MTPAYAIEHLDDSVRAAWTRLLPHQERAVAGGKLDWKFGAANPAGQGLIATCRGPDQTILGLNGFMAVNLCLRGRDPVTGYQSMDTIVDPIMRGKGVFTAMHTVFNEASGAGFVHGFPNAASGPAFFNKLGWQRLSSVPMLIKPLRSGFLTRKITRLLPDVRLPEWSARARDLDEVMSFGPATTKVWQDFAHRHDLGAAVERNAAYLNWRLRDHPSETYRLYSHHDRAFTAASLSHKHGAHIGYLMEAFGDDAVLAGVIRATTDRLRAEGAELSLAWCPPHAPNYHAYRRAGFLPLPDRLRPIDISFGVRPIAVNHPAFGDFSDWYLSYLDSDTV